MGLPYSRGFGINQYIPKSVFNKFKIQLEGIRSKLPHGSVYRTKY